jgi:hypothetical protein
MGGKATKGVKGKWFPAIALTVLTTSGLVGMSIFLSHRPAETSLVSSTLSPLAPSETEIAKLPESVSAIAPSPVTSPPVPAQSKQVRGTPSAAVDKTGSLSIRLGSLRISNPTYYPVRVALLERKRSQTGSATGSGYEAPAHWDFAPQEGSDKGLIVSLPDRPVKVKPGDILVAFAQDGSRRYWGPYVVGSTPIPNWNPKSSEWELELQP